MSSDSSPSSTPSGQQTAAAAQQALANITANVEALQGSNTTSISKSNIMLAVIQALCESLQNYSGITDAETNVIQSETQTSMTLNKSIQGTTDVVAPSNASSVQLDQINAVNQNITVVRQSVLGQVNAINQNIKTNTTMASQQANLLSQCSTEVSSIMSTISTLAKLVLQMSGQS